MESWPRGTRAGAAGVLFGLTAAVLTVIGSFQVLADVRQADFRLTITSWDDFMEAIPSRLELAGSPGTPLLGVPLVAAAAVLLAALLAVALPGDERLRRAAGMAAVVAAAFLAATVCAAGLVQRFWLAAFDRSLGGEGAQVGQWVRGGPALWTLLMAAGLSAVAAVVGWRASRNLAERVEPDTPVLGTPEVVVHRLPDAPANQPDQC
ncbi:MAG TPA: hypothetical protein VFV67_03105 [Actinophytocola sp.]|uniref:hypothetical protein n=1 Tax=Actinophytocola sp. TaxID=1872138 RepID=UPI002DBB8907|nr:hypothetical protein [Actinophytocola sp.]HEU5469615.1 hypothetical protein [Actinophytocola sp.]